MARYFGITKKEKKTLPGKVGHAIVYESYLNIASFFFSITEPHRILLLCLPSILCTAVFLGLHHLDPSSYSCFTFPILWPTDLPRLPL